MLAVLACAVTAGGGCALVGVSTVPCVWCAGNGGTEVFKDRFWNDVEVVLPSYCGA